MSKELVPSAQALRPLCTFIQNNDPKHKDKARQEMRSVNVPECKACGIAQAVMAAKNVCPQYGGKSLVASVIALIAINK